MGKASGSTSPGRRTWTSSRSGRRRAASSGRKATSSQSGLTRTTRPRGAPAATVWPGETSTSATRPAHGARISTGRAGPPGMSVAPSPRRAAASRASSATRTARARSTSARLVASSFSSSFKRSTRLRATSTSAASASASAWTSRRLRSPTRGTRRKSRLPFATSRPRCGQGSEPTVASAGAVRTASPPATGRTLPGPETLSWSTPSSAHAVAKDVRHCCSFRKETVSPPASAALATAPPGSLAVPTRTRPAGISSSPAAERTRKRRSNSPGAAGLISTGKMPSRFGVLVSKTCSRPSAERSTIFTVPERSGEKSARTVTCGLLAAVWPATRPSVSAKIS